VRPKSSNKSNWIMEEVCRDAFALVAEIAFWPTRVLCEISCYTNTQSPYSQFALTKRALTAATSALLISITPQRSKRKFSIFSPTFVDYYGLYISRFFNFFPMIITYPFLTHVLLAFLICSNATIIRRTFFLPYKRYIFIFFVDNILSQQLIP